MARLVFPGIKTPEQRNESRAWESRLLKLEAMIVKFKRDRAAAIEALGKHVNRQTTLAKNIAALVKRCEELEHELARISQGGAVPGHALHDSRGGGEQTEANRQGD